MQSITFVTTSESKIREVEAMTRRAFDWDRAELDELQSMDLDVIVAHKLRQAWDQIRRPVMVEDSGIYFEDWGGFPGPFVKHLQATMGYAKVWKVLGPTRRVQQHVVVGYTDGQQTVLGHGSVTGTIIPAEQMTGSVAAFDLSFLHDGATKVYGAMTQEEKFAVSARMKALNDLQQQLPTLWEA